MIKATLNIILLVLCSFLVKTPAAAQSCDFFSSNIMKSLINPSLAGNNDFDWNIQNIFSTKRNIVDQNRNSIFLGGDYKQYFSADNIVIGAHISQTAYTDFPMSNLEFMSKISYKKALNNQNLFIGLQAGLVSMQFDANEIVFPDQYNIQTGGYDNLIGTEDPTTLKDKTYFDLALGLAYEREIKGFHSQFGLSFFHLNRPNYSLTNRVQKKPIDVIAHVSTSHFLGDELTLIPEYYLFYNQYFIENKIGLKTSLSTKRFSIPIKSVWFAPYMSIRNNKYPDIFLTQLGFQFYKFTTILNYNFSMGVTNNLFKNYRVFEIGIIFNGFNAFPKSYTIPCEIY
jgi:type IX secretion system PorP/SprF family membrane protein